MGPNSGRVQQPLNISRLSPFCCIDLAVLTPAPEPEQLSHSKPTRCRPCANPSSRHGRRQTSIPCINHDYHHPHSIRRVLLHALASKSSFLVSMMARKLKRSKKAKLAECRRNSGHAFLRCSVSLTVPQVGSFSSGWHTISANVSPNTDSTIAISLYCLAWVVTTRWRLGRNIKLSCYAERR